MHGAPRFAPESYWATCFGQGLSPNWWIEPSPGQRLKQMDEIQLRYRVGQVKICRLNNHTEKKLA